MEGQIKITVIATGFDRARTFTAAPRTPVDLSAYAPPRVQVEERLVVNGGRVITRRPALDLPTAGGRVSPSAATATGETADDMSPLDVPAFLRRQE
jgi:hypothetical protein